MSIARYMPANDDRGCGTVVRNDESGIIVFYDDYAAEVARLNEQAQELKGRLQLVAELNDARAALHAETEKQVQALAVEGFAAKMQEWGDHWEKNGVRDGSASRCFMAADDARKYAARIRAGEVRL